MQGDENYAEMELGVEKVRHEGDGFFQVGLGVCVIADGVVEDAVEVEDFRVVRGLGEQLERGIVQDSSALHDAAMAVGHVFAKTDIGND